MKHAWMCSGINVWLIIPVTCCIYSKNCYTLYSVTNIFSLNFCNLTSIIAYSIMQKWPKYYKETHPKELMWNSKNTSFEKFNKDIKLWYFLSLHYFSFYFYIIFYYSFLYSIISTLYSCIFSLFSTFSSSSHSYWC